MIAKIQEIIHEDTHYQKGALNMRAQKCFAVKVLSGYTCTCIIVTIHVHVYTCIIVLLILIHPLLLQFNSVIFLYNGRLTIRLTLVVSMIHRCSR